MDALYFLKFWIKEKKEKFDTVILDPPYNLKKANEKYKGKYINSFIEILKLIPLTLKNNGILITFGFNSVGASQLKGFKKEKIVLICHGGGQNDSIGVIERKVINNLKFEEKT